MKQYEEYKTTNITWLDKIPKHWNELRGKLIYKKVDRNPEENDEVITCFRDGQVTLRKNRRLSGYTESIKEIGYQHINKGDLVIHIMDAFAGAIGVSDSNGKGSPVYNVCVSRICVNNYFYAYLLREMARNGYISSLYRGIRERSSDFRFNVFANQIYPVPPREEQDKIVAYLDYQTSNINKLILSKRKQIELLEEYKKTKISETVTKGLNPNAEMKESGIDWIGQIPKHWDVKKINELFIHRKTKVSDKEYSPLSVTKNGVVPQLMDAVKTDNGDNRKLVCANDFVINSRSDRKSSCGVSDLNGSVSLIYLVLYLIKKDSFNIKLIHYLFRSYYFSEEFYRNGRGIVADLWTTRYTEMKNIYIPIPPLDEQKEIAAYLDNLTFKLDNLISKHKLYIEKLEEYKKILISDVVTGKIDVRDIDIPEYEKVDITEEI